MPGGKNRPDRSGPHRVAYEQNKRRILATRDICGICGRPVDKSLRFPHPLSPTIDHIIPVDRGGHPSDIDNLQLAHFTCNRQKSNKLREPKEAAKQQEQLSNRVLPQARDWAAYRSGGA